MASKKYLSDLVAAAAKRDGNGKFIDKHYVNKDTDILDYRGYADSTEITLEQLSEDIKGKYNMTSETAISVAALFGAKQLEGNCLSTSIRISPSTLITFPENENSTCMGIVRISSETISLFLLGNHTLSTNESAEQHCVQHYVLSKPSGAQIWDITSSSIIPDQLNKSGLDKAVQLTLDKAESAEQSINKKSDLIDLTADGELSLIDTENKNIDYPDAEALKNTASKILAYMQDTYTTKASFDAAGTRIDNLETTITSLADSAISHADNPHVNETLLQFTSSMESIEMEAGLKITLNDGSTAYVTQLVTLEENLKELYYPMTDDLNAGYGWKVQCTSAETGGCSFLAKCDKRIKISYNGQELADPVKSEDQLVSTFTEFISALSNGSSQRLDARYKNTCIQFYLILDDIGDGPFWGTILITSTPAAGLEEYSVEFDKYQTNVRTAPISQFSALDMFDRVQYFATSTGTDCSVITGAISSQDNLECFHSYFGIKSPTDWPGPVVSYSGIDDNGMPASPSINQGSSTFKVICPFPISRAATDSAEEFLSTFMSMSEYVEAEDYSTTMNSELVNKVFCCYLVDTDNDELFWFFFLCVDNSGLQLKDVKLRIAVPPETTFSAVERLSDIINRKQNKLSFSKEFQINSDGVVRLNNNNITINYNKAANIPSINALSLTGDRSSDDYGLASKTQIIGYSDGDSLTLENNTEYRNSQEALALSLLILDNYPNDYISGVVFKSGETATTLTYPDFVKFSGDDVNNGVFVPNANTDYNLIFWHDGLNINAVARGV